MLTPSGQRSRPSQRSEGNKCLIHPLNNLQQIDRLGSKEPKVLFKPSANDWQ